MDYISDFHEPFTLLPTWRIVRNCFLFHQPQVKTLHFRYYIIGSALPDLNVVQLIFIIAVQWQPTLTHWGLFSPIFVSDVFQTNVKKMAELGEHAESVSVRAINASYYNNNQIQILLNLILIWGRAMILLVFSFSWAFIAANVKYQPPTVLPSALHRVMDWTGPSLTNWLHACPLPNNTIPQIHFPLSSVRSSVTEMASCSFDESLIP